MLGRKLVAYRGDSGRVVVLDGRCVHQGADLSAGAIVGESLRCPFHGWCFGADGVCNHIPATDDVPGFARVRSYPAEERHGDIYFFNAHAALFPLPFFRDADPGQFAAARVFTIEYDGPWYMIVANAFDMQHFRVVHDRKLIGEPVIDHPTPFARRIRYEVSVDGDILADRFLRRFVGDRVKVDQTVYGGNVLTTRAQFKNAESYVFFVASSTPDGRTRMDLTPMLRRPCAGTPSLPRRAVEFISLWVRRRLTGAFLTNENTHLKSIRYSPTTLIEADRPIIDYLHWLTTLPAGHMPPPGELP